VQGVPVGIRVDGHRGNVELPARPDDPDGDLPSVGDQDPRLRHSHAPRAIIGALMGPVNTSGQDSLGRAVREAGIEVLPVWFDEVGSTNDEARRLAREGAPEWTVVAAGHQTAGRGRLGRPWFDVPGSALLFSVILRPAMTPAEAPLLGLLAAVDLIAAASTPDLRSKWPNDLVIGERKVAGILMEAGVVRDRLSHVILGIGVNLAMRDDELPVDLRRTATSLFAEPGALLTAFLVGFRSDVHRPSRGIIEDYRGVCDTMGRRVRATATSGEVIEGIAVDIDDRGALVIEGDGLRMVVASGEVAHLR